MVVPSQSVAQPLPSKPVNYSRQPGSKASAAPNSNAPAVPPVLLPTLSPSPAAANQTLGYPPNPVPTPTSPELLWWGIFVSRDAQLLHGEYEERENRHR
jgi:hypothetical protein